MITFFALLIVIAVIVFVHELGHFAAARWAGARVEIFSIGFGKALAKWHDRKGTEWRIGWLPLGGFVQIYGQDDMFNRKKYHALPSKDKNGHYLSLPAWKQAIVIGAGVFMNLVVAWILYTGLFSGTQTVQLPIIGTSENSALKVGDRIMMLQGKQIKSWEGMLQEKELNKGNPSNLVILREDKLVNLGMGDGTWGITPDLTKTETVHNGLFQAAKYAGVEIWTQAKMMTVMLGQMVSGTRSTKQLGGLISIAEISGKALSAGFTAMLALIALLSVNLAVINLLPLPVLDGGYLLILAMEAVVRRKLQGKWTEWIMRFGWWLIIALMTFALWNDIARLA